MINNSSFDNNVVSLLQFNMENHKVFSSSNNMKSDDKILVGHEILKKTAAAFLPATDPETEDSIDFPEIFHMRLDDRMNKVPYYSKAILFTGESGSGKHTVHNAFISEVISKSKEFFSDDSMLNSYLKYYRLDASKEKINTKADRISFITNLFASLDEIAGSEWAEEYLLLVSLGDITEIMSHKSSARYFSDNLASFLERSKADFFILSLYEGNASEIKEKYKSPFFVYEVKAPDIDERKQYISVFLNKYQNIIYEYNVDELSSMTEGFTFGMLEEFKCNCLRYVKSTIADLGYNYAAYINNEAVANNRMIKLPKKILQIIIDGINCKRYEKRYVTHSFAAKMSVTQSNSISDNICENKLVASDKNNLSNNETKAVKNDGALTEEDAKEIVDQITSYSQMNEMYFNFTTCV